MKLQSLLFKFVFWFISVMVIFCILLVCGCETHASSNPKRQAGVTPTNAINVVDKGNGWIVFDLDGNRFLYHRSVNGNQAFEAITVIPNE